MSSFYEALPSFGLTVQRYDSVATVVVSGELDLTTAPRLSAAAAEHGDAKVLVLDMTATRSSTPPECGHCSKPTAAAPAQAHASWLWQATGRYAEC
jgi:hypothetical protein